MSYLRKICFLVLLISVLAPQAGLAYTTPGTGVNWSGNDLVANSGGVVTFDTFSDLYTSTEGIVVSPTDTITILDDFLVDAVADNDWTIQGVLFVGEGDTTSTDTIEFSGSGTDGPAGIRVEEGGRLAMVRCLMVGGGADGDDTAIQVTEGTALIYGSRFTDWAGNVINTFGCPDIIIEDCIIHDNHEYGISIRNGSTGLIRGCYFENNNLASPNSSKIVLNVGPQGVNHAVIEDCHIVGAAGNKAGGIVVTNLLGETQTAIVRNTIVEDACYGISVQYGGAFAEIIGCTFINNTAVNDPNYYGMGISVYGPASIEAAGNTITGNLWGVTVTPSTQGEPTSVILGIDGSEEPGEAGLNSIYDNSNTGFDHGYNLWNNSTIDISAQNNYWGTMNETAVAENIHDFADDATKGVVTYLPIWDGVQPNYPPFIDWQSPEDSDLTVVVGSSITFDATAIDANDDPLTSSIFLNGAEIDMGIPATLQFDAIGDQTVMIVFTDPQAAADSTTWNIHVVENTAPVIQTFTPEDTELTIDVDDNIVFNATATDADNDTLTWEVWLNGTMIRTTIPADLEFSEVGVDTVELVVRDTHDGSDSVQWIITVIDPNSVGEEGDLPSEFAVSAYPNPFNAQVRLQYSLPSYKDVTYAIYSIDGRLVERQALGGQIPGHHEITWNAEGAASGVYLVRFNAGSETISRKITLVR